RGQDLNLRPSGYEVTGLRLATSVLGGVRPAQARFLSSYSGPHRLQYALVGPICIDKSLTTPCPSPRRSAGRSCAWACVRPPRGDERAGLRTVEGQRKMRSEDHQ